MKPQFQSIRIKLEATKNLLRKGIINPIDIVDDIDLIHQDLLNIKKLLNSKKENKNLELIKEIAEYTIEVFGIEMIQLRGSSRVYDIALARQVFALSAKENGFTLKQIADAINRKDHTTALRMLNRKSFNRRLNKTDAKEMYKKMAKKVFDKFNAI